MTVQLSRSEIKSEVEKAIRGAGFEWGRAKDGGVMAAWLAAHDQVFLGALLRGLDIVSTQHEDDDNTVSGPQSIFAPTDAMMLAEYVLASNTPWTGAVIGVRFMLAGMGIVTGEQKVSLSLHDDTGLIAYAQDGEIWVSHNWTAQDRVLTLKPVQAISRDDDMLNGLDAVAWSAQTAHEASQSCWQRLGLLAHKVYVKETEEKRRSGAGAGDIDNS